MFEENMSQEFKLKTVDEIRNSLNEEVNRNELMSKRHKKVCRDLNYVNHLLACSVIGLKICGITPGVKKYKSIIKKKK